MLASSPDGVNVRALLMQDDILSHYSRNDIHIIIKTRQELRHLSRAGLLLVTYWTSTT
jgi:hypothetical protein